MNWKNYLVAVLVQRVFMSKKIDFELVKAFATAAIRATKSQANVQVEVGKPNFRGETFPTDVDVAGNIDVASPHFYGSFTLAYPRATFLKLTKQMTGEEHKIIDSKVRDGAAEFLNIIYGEVKSVLNGNGYELPMAIPEVFISDIAVEKMLTTFPAVVIPFNSAVGPFFAHIGLKDLAVVEAPKNAPLGKWNPNSFPEETRILIVDDMGVMRKTVRRSLNELGYMNIEEACDGMEGLQAVEKSVRVAKPFNLILSDWNMPKMMGIDFLKKVRANPKTKATPFILLTAESENSQVMEGISVGASAYVLKPFTVETLNEKLEAVYVKLHSKKVA